MNAALAVSVSAYSLSVDAAETMRTVLDSENRTRGQRLVTALEFASRDSAATAVYPVPPFAHLDLDSLDPARCVLPDVAAELPCWVVRQLAAAGYLTTRSVWRDTSGETYADDGRTLTLVQVVRPFALVRVQYGHTNPYSTGPADRWEVTERTPLVGRGWYLLAETGDYRSELVGAAGLDVFDSDTDLHPDAAAELLTIHIAEIEGFGASTCQAGCDRCGARWSADSGSWHFHPDSELFRPDGTEPADAVPVQTFHFDDADDFADDTIRCPHCGTGRVGFQVF